MRIVVNGEILPEEFIQMEAGRLASHPDFTRIKDETERQAKLRAAAEDAAINRMLMAQTASRDPRPVPEAEIDRGCQEFQAQNGVHGAFDAQALRSQVEARLRVKRTVQDIRNAAPVPSEEAIRRTYDDYRDTFQGPERVRAKHIVKHTNEGLTEAEAKLGIEQAQSELECGTPFAAVIEKFSDCKENGGDVGWFIRGGDVFPEFVADN